jgi:site-specific DNA-cytosine methylase
VIEVREIKVFHVCGSIGGGAKGFQRGSARLGNMEARFRCLGSVDVDPAACRDFERLIGSKATVMDLFSREQYIAWHGHEPPAGWREVTPEDIRRAAGYERPHIVFTSSPCKGFSGLLSEGKSKTAKYQALNELALRSVWLALEAWADDPPEFFLLENVPRIATRGRYLLDRLRSMYEHYGYASAETTHDCGELGGLAQSRKRFLLVARHQAKVPPFLYEPQTRPLRAVSTVLDRCPLPGDIERAGPMHRVPSLHWKTWVRLAFVEAGNDWRSLQKLRVANGVLQDFCVVPDHIYNGGTLPTHDNYSVSDMRPPAGAAQYQQYGVLRMSDTAGAVIGVKSPGQGTFSVADPRPQWNRYSSNYRIVRYGDASPTVIAGGKGVQGGWLSVADPRPSIDRSAGNYLTGGHYGVVPYAASTMAVTGSACHDNGHWSVADPRLPLANDKLSVIIRALDGTWHRPFTTFELAAIQSLVDPEEQLELDGLSDQAWRERIGNAVPPDAAEAMAGVFGLTLLAAWSGQTFLLNSMPIWVRPVAVAIALPGQHGSAC